MRRTPLIFAVLLAGTAHAQFANRSFGAGLSFVKFTGVDAAAGVEYAVPLTLEGSVYIENRFELYAQVPFMVVEVAVGADRPGQGRGEVFGTGGHLGARYLLLQESVRPYVGLELAAMAFFTKPDPKVFWGPGASAGVDWFILDTVSIGARGFFDLFIELNFPVRPTVGGGLNFAAYF